ncbi:Uncharacterized conserved protein, contains ParB-like and HNH nuclease domains [Flavobacterium glycines]|uniref:Uncharacterized conserved protein, contains ParB-like and HNH nuclease domains n=1 Tax=Flavobacterium glycines TaxID=551990 RepID=A0A1B9DWN3_9FLAO|nr:DUF262 domain-containing protein [Flavobacterium glycines]OCB74104.1 hypothetical protein FBGL_02855 [Flavobacterium glycines]GEL09521.1 hypothetical protein FGL01_02600 [Flavobacterium glycines]SDJ03801.1 Uncharacterized conserved protein, contains ParB-like and HNH nuclease domains [Flavobacterium glycines]
MSQFITLNTIIGNGKSYEVPIYQRDYSWGKDDWEDLWNDIAEIPTDKIHYLGYLVLQPIKDGEQSFWIIDGQQRLTTLSILTIAVTALLNKWTEEDIDSKDNKIRAEKITERYLGNYSLSKLNLDPKLKLNRNNDDYYKSWLLKLRQPTALAKLKPSQRLLQKAFNYFFDELDNKFKDNKSGADLADFLEKIIGNGIVFTQIIVDNDLDAFKVFETLNARGVKLSTADLLKNYLFKLTHQLGEIDLDEAERRWQNITNTIQSNDLTTFIRHYWNSKYKLERQPTLFKAIKREINSAEKAFQFLNDLEDISIYYTAFNNPNDELWDKDEKASLKLLNLLNVSTCFSLMLSSLKNLSRAEYKIILKELSIITFRYNLSDLNPNEAERIFSKVANDISNKNIKNAKDSIIALKSIYVIDDNFEQIFSTISINTRRKKDLAKYILVKIENQIANKDYQPEEAVSTIEHILPENPGGIWDESFPVEIQEDYIYRLGNYSLLESNINNKLGNNMPFSEKLEKYKKSSYKLSNEYCNYEKFTPKEISLRQEKIAKIAKGIWRSTFLQSLA